MDMDRVNLGKALADLNQRRALSTLRQTWFQREQHVWSNQKALYHLLQTTIITVFA